MSITNKNDVLGITEFIGQNRVKNSLMNLVARCIKNNAPFPSLILCGENGMGKRTLAKAISKELNVSIKIISGPAIKLQNDLYSILTNIQAGDILFIDEIHRLVKAIEEVLYPALEEYALDIIIGKGPSKRQIRLKLPKFSIIGSSDEKISIDPHLQNYCGLFEFDPYSSTEMELIIKKMLETGNEINEDAVTILAKSCDGNPGKAKIIIKWIRDYTDTFSTGKITSANVKEAIKFFGGTADSSLIENIDAKLKKFDGYQFEQFTASIFRKKGYLVHITKSSGDHGIDLILKREGEKIAVQCKHWDKPVGEAIIRDFYGSIVSANIDHGIIITTSTFTPQAIVFSKNKPIDLMDLKMLKKLISSRDVMRE